MAISDKEQAIQAHDMINQFSIVLKTGHFHNIENDAVVEAIVKLRDIINPFIKSEGSLKIELLGEFFYVNGNRIRYPLECLLNFDYMAEEFRKKEIGSVKFLSPVEIRHIKILLNAFIRAGQSNAPYDTAALLINETGNIVIDRLKRIKEEVELSRRKLVKRTYFNAVSFTRGVMTSMKKGEQISLRRAKRVIETMVDALLSEEQLLVGMTSIKDYDDYTYHHSVNVSILSIAVGHRIGLSKRHITALGMTALFHDLGKTEIPQKVLNKKSYLSEEEWEIIRKHPFWGAMAILQLKGIDELTVQSAIVAFQHHMHCDQSGYPKLRGPMDISLYTKIISIADQYDAMTSSRIYRTNPMSPDKVLGIMMEKSGTSLDPILLKFFVNMVGVYPIGSLVLFDTREMGLVYEGNHLDPERPRVMVIVDGAGNNVTGYVVDITEKDSSGRHLRTITNTLDPKQYGISLAEHLL